MRNVWAAIRQLGGYLSREKGWLIFAIVLTIIQTAFIALNPFFIGLVINELSRNVMDIAANVPGAAVNLPYVAKMIAVMLAFAFAVEISAFFANFVMTDAVQRAMLHLRNDLVKKLNHLPMRFFDQNRQGDLLSRVTNDVDAISGALQQSILQVISSIFSILFSIVMMFLIFPRLAGIGLIILALSGVVLVVLVRRSQKQFQILQDQLGEMSALVQESYSGFSVIKLYNKEDDYVDAFAEVNDKLAAAAVRANITSGMTNPMVGAFVNFGYLATAVVGAGYVFNGALAIGSLQSMSQYVWQIAQPISQIAQLTGALQSAAASTVRVFDILNSQEEQADLFKDNLPAHNPGQVSFENLRFGYTKDKPVLNGLNLDLKSGQTVAIVGPTGVGKTTITNLLLRFYEIWDGSIRIDGRDIRDMTRAQLRSLIGIVPQDPWLYHTSIAENIRFGKLDADEGEIERAARNANVDDYIRHLPEGYETIMDAEAGNISQGQKQLITIARALISNPRILVLDEATSSVDTRIELLIQETMQEIMKGRTSFVIAHRLSTIREADVILMMKDGNVAEQGTHRELMERRGAYYDLYASQFGEERVS